MPRRLLRGRSSSRPIVWQHASPSPRRTTRTGLKKAEPTTTRTIRTTRNNVHIVTSTTRSPQMPPTPNALGRSHQCVSVSWASQPSTQLRTKRSFWSVAVSIDTTSLHFQNTTRICGEERARKKGEKRKIINVTVCKRKEKENEQLVGLWSIDRRRICCGPSRPWAQEDRHTHTHTHEACGALRGAGFRLIPPHRRWQLQRSSTSTLPQPSEHAPLFSLPRDASCRSSPNPSHTVTKPVSHFRRWMSGCPVAPARTLDISDQKQIGTMHHSYARLRTRRITTWITTWLRLVLLVSVFLANNCRAPSLFRVPGDKSQSNEMHTITCLVVSNYCMFGLGKAHHHHKTIYGHTSKSRFGGSETSSGGKNLASSEDITSTQHLSCP